MSVVARGWVDGTMPDPMVVLALRGEAVRMLGKKPRVWVMQHFAPNATPWNKRSWLSKSSLPKPTERH
jgi:hypothetical protein